MYVPAVALLLHAVNFAKLLVIADALFTWVLPPEQFPRSLTMPLLDPIYAPIRATLPLVGPVDFSPLVLLAVLFVIGRFLESRGAPGAS